jgi:PAS domain S-box-containing protein
MAPNKTSSMQAAELEREIMLRLLHHMNRPDSLHGFISEAAHLLREWSGCDAAGVRIRVSEDFPYCATSGFSEEFVAWENRLCSLDERGEPVRDTQGNTLLECMCGRVLRGDYNPNLPFFSDNGSFWTGSTTDLLSSLSEEDLETATRNRCNAEGYESVALIPLRQGGDTLGLLQLNDCRPHLFDEDDIGLFERFAATMALGIVRHRETEALRRSEKLLNKSQAIARIGSWYLDLIDNRLSWSDEVYRIFGLQPRELRATYEDFLAIVHPQDRAKVDSAYRTSLRNGNDSYEIEHRIVRRDTGEIRHVYEKCEHLRDNSGRIVGSEGIVHDITERKRTEEELRENQEKFQTLIDQTADMLFLHNLDGDILDVNQKAVDQSGYSRRELLGMRIADLDPDFHEREQNGAFWTTFDMNRSHSFEARHRRKDGTIFPVEVTISKIRLGDELRIMGLVRDITERKQYEEALIRSKEQAEVANRAKSDFLARMSHEIRTPMNSIIGMLRLVLMNELPDKQRERVQVARDSSESLLWLLNDLLDLSRIESGKFSLLEKEFSLRPLMNNLYKEMELSAAEKGLSFSFRMDDALPGNLIGDPHRLKQIIRNLLNNAVKYTDRGWIFLQARRADEGSGSGSGDGFVDVLFEVIDTGRGIDAESIATVFQFYDQGKQELLSPEQGTGLGLAICRKLAEQMGGSIWVESSPGEGSVFYVQLPMRLNAESGSEEDLALESEHVEKLPPLRILLAEDQKMNQIFTVDLLSSFGHSVEVVENGRQALEILGRKSFDLVLMDLKMPVMDGIEAAMRIRTSDPMIMNPDIPIIGLSAHASPDHEMEQFRSVGFDDYVVKPMSFEKFFAAMKKVVG